MTTPNMTTDSFQSLCDKYTPTINQALLDNLPEKDTTTDLDEALRYCLSTEAKRIRPLLAIASYRQYETDISPILPFCCAIEYIHTYSLIHDDLPAMDNDDFRRGQPSCHKQYSEEIAILAGDTLNTLAFEIMAKNQANYFNPLAVLSVIEYMGSCFGVHGMAGGQALDLSYDAQSSSEKILYETHYKKTGAMIECSIVSPAILTEADESYLQLMRKAGYHTGLLFQIVDDILDVTSTKEALGKSVNKDIEQNKSTFVSFYGLDKSKKLAQEEYELSMEILKDLSTDSHHLQLVLDFLISRTK